MNSDTLESVAWTNGDKIVIASNTCDEESVISSPEELEALIQYLKDLGEKVWPK